MKRNCLLKMIAMLCALALGSVSVWATDYVINSSNFTKPNSGSGYAAYDGNRTINGITITSSNVMVQSSALQFKKSVNAALYNSDAIPGIITKITLSTSTNFTIYVGTSSNPSTTTVSSGSTISGSYSFFKIVNKSSSTATTATITVEYTPTHTLTYSATNGSIYGQVYNTSTAVASGAAVAEGGKVTLTAQPADGYEFSSWEVNGTGSSLSSTTTNPTTFTMGSANSTVTANFTATGGSSLTASDLTITNQNTVLSFDLYNNTTAQVINYTTSSTGAITIEPASPTSYFSYVHDQENKTITVTPLAVTTSAQTVTISQQADATYAAGSKTFTVSVADSSPLANIAALTAKTAATSYSVTLNNAVVTYINGNYAYIQDASGAVAMYKSGHGLNAGDVLNGTATVAYQLRNGNPQITDLSGITPVSGDAPSPTTVAQSAWNYTFNNVLSQYFQITGATITSSNNKYYVSLGGESIQLYKVGTALSSLDLNKTYTITGFPTLYVNNNTTTKELQIFVAPVAQKTDPTITFNNGSVRVGGTLNLSSLFTSNSNGAVSYSITAGGSYATLEGSTLTGTAEGSVTVKATQEESSSYNEAEVTATITVNPALVLSSIAITTAPTKTTYNEGESFDPTGMVVTATYTDNSTEAITGYTYAPNGALTTSDTEITISYTENAITKTAKQAITVNEVVDYATLPFTWTSSFGSAPTGITNNGSITTGGSGSYLKFEGKEGQSLVLKINERPGKLSFDIKGNPSNNVWSGTFIVETSDENGIQWSSLESYSSVSTDNYDSKSIELGESVRYIKWTYSKTTGNLAMNNIGLTAYEAPSTDPSIVITTEEPVDVSAAAGSGELALTYEYFDVNEANDFAVQFYDANNEELNGANAPTWITVSVVAATTSGYKVTYSVNANDGAERSAYFKVFADAGEDFVFSNKVTITQAEYEAPPIPDGWVETSLASLTADDVFIIVCNNGSGLYALPNNGGTSNPSAYELSGTIPNKLKWNVSGNASDGYVFYPNGTNETWLYCTNSNQGVKIGTNDNKLFSISDGYLMNTANNRYVGVYDSKDWRCYDNTNGNIAGQTFAFYKKVTPDGVPSSINVTAVMNKGSYWATFYHATAQYVLPEGAQAFTMNASHQLYRVGNNGRVIPEGTAVIIVSEFANIELVQKNAGDGTIHDDSEVETPVNILKGSNTAVNKSDITGTPYVLGINASGELGFYHISGDTIPANKAYIIVE